MNGTSFQQHYHNDDDSINGPNGSTHSRLSGDYSDGSYHRHQNRRAPTATMPNESSIGSVNVFRSVAMAKRWAGTSRRRVQAKMAASNRQSMAGHHGAGLSPTALGDAAHERTSLVPNAMDGAAQDTFDDGADMEAPSTLAALREIIIGKFVSIFLLLIPLAYLSHKLEWSPAWIFWLNFFVMIPLAAILGDFTEEVALHTNQTIGGLVNATFGNAVEVVVALQALLKNEIRVVQASMIGSIFSNLLLVLGCCFFFGGLKHKELSFNSTAATANMGLLALSSIALVLPTPFAEYYQIEDSRVLVISRLAAIFLMSMYIQLLIFQLKTHAYIFEDGGVADGDAGEEQTNDDEKVDGDNGTTEDPLLKINSADPGEEAASISLTVALLGLLTTTLLVTFFSEYLVDSIDGYCESSGVSRTFVGLIILPIVGNAVEHITAVTVAMKDKMDLAMGVAVGSCTQISLFVVPLTVLAGWALDRKMTLNFPMFEVTLYILSVITVSICLSNPKGNWLEGSLLITTYIMIAVGFWFEKVVDF